MAWLEPFIATLPQWVAAAKNTSIFNFDGDGHDVDNAADNHHISSNTQMNNNQTDNVIHINALSMYQRAMTLQQTNSESVNNQIFAIERSHSFNSRQNGILSDEEYIDLHSRLSIEELSSELYHDEDTDENQFESWLNIQNENEFIINNKNKKLNEKHWKTLCNVIKENKSKEITLKLSNIVLDETSSRYLHKLTVNLNKNKVLLRKLHIENAFFLNKLKNFKEDLYLLFTQNEGMNNDNDDDDLFLNDSDFDFNGFCAAILCNKHLKEMVITNTNLSDILSENEERKQMFIDILSNHNGLQNINLSGNNISSGSLFIDVLFRRQIPLNYLDLSFNPISQNDIKSIKSAATKQYISPFQPFHDIYDIDEHQFISSLFPISSSPSKIHRKKHKKMCHKFVFEQKQKEEDQKAPGFIMDDHNHCNEHHLMLQI